MATIETGYMEDAYLSELAYMAGRIEDCLGTQVEMRLEGEADDPHLLTQVDLLTGSDKDLLTQTEFIIVGKPALLTQAELKTSISSPLNTQVEGKIVAFENFFGVEVKFGKTRMRICGGYLDDLPYMESPYLSARYCGDMFTQVELKRFEKNFLGTQIEARIVSEQDDPHLGTQVEGKIFKTNPINMQVLFTTAKKLNTQVNLFIYNNTQLRFLCAFMSRGTVALGGTNWTSEQTIAAGDFSPNNLNTDIIEQRTQTSGVPPLWELRCDTGDDSNFPDTVAVLNHNFTLSARVEWQGSDDPAFGTIKFTVVMLTELENMYYVAPTLPTIPARYYRFTIQDSTNPDPDGLKIGTIVFGKATIMTRKETYVNPVSFGRRHFKNSLETEGFTSVSNDRATRRFLNLTFSQLLRTGGNFQSLQNYITTAKTDLKCLIIPRPTVPSALAVFAKMSQIPEELHNAIDDDNWRIDMTFDWDESL